MKFIKIDDKITLSSEFSITRNHLNLYNNINHHILYKFKSRLSREMNSIK